MKIDKISSQTRHHWLVKPFLSHPYHVLLIEKGSLTARLQQRYSNFSVKSLMVKYAKSTQDEANLLHLATDNTVLRREVLLYGNGLPVVFAQSILPRKSLYGEWRRLGTLGNKPLGAVLFANPKVKRTPLSYKKLSPNHALYRSAARYLTDKPAFLWARRSVFSLNCANIMVTEVFLPHLVAGA
ncbi:MAG: chorismate lyase [Methylotenera sp.]